MVGVAASNPLLGNRFPVTDSMECRFPDHGGNNELNCNGETYAKLDKKRPKAHYTLVCSFQPFSVYLLAPIPDHGTHFMPEEEGRGNSGYIIQECQSQFDKRIAEGDTIYCCIFRYRVAQTIWSILFIFFFYSYRFT